MYCLICVVFRSCVLCRGFTSVKFLGSLWKFLAKEIELPKCRLSFFTEKMEQLNTSSSQDKYIQSLLNTIENQRAENGALQVRLPSFHRISVKFSSVIPLPSTSIEI